MKCLLERIENKEKEMLKQNEKKEQELQSVLQNCSYITENRPSRTPNLSKLLPDECIFCNKPQYKDKKKVKLRLCCQFRAVNAIRTAAERKGDFPVLGLLSEDLIAREGKYHNSCYIEYTRGNYKEKELEIPQPTDNENQYKQFELEAFQEVVRYCHSLINESPRIVKFQMLTCMIEDYFKEKNLPIKVSTKKNLRRNIENTFKNQELLFVNINKALYLYPHTLKIEKLVTDFVNLQTAINGEGNKMITAAAIDIRKQIKAMQDEIPWPPEPQNLSPDQFKIPEGLETFLSVLYFGDNREKELNPRKARFKFSIGQDLVYTVTDGRVKTPKSILFPCAVKTLTNNTELVNIVNRLGHGVSYTLLMELFTENAYKIYEERLENSVVLPRDALKEEFTIYVADNIDRLEETLSGMKFSLKQLFHHILDI